MQETNQPLAVITGATKGIGRAIAFTMIQNGFNVAVCARNAEDVSQLKNDLLQAAQNAGTAIPVIIAEPCDVRKRDDITRFANAINESGMVPAVVVNNAGVFLPGQVHNEEEGNLELLIETNLYSAYHLTRALLPRMIEQKHGHIFNISSVAGLQAYANGGSYSISKFALTGFSKALREEMKPYNIRVTALMPGAVLTNSWAGVDLPESRFMKAEDVAELLWSIYRLSEQTVVEEVLLRPMLGDI